MNVLLDKRKNLHLTRDQYQYIIRKDTGKTDKDGNVVYSNLKYVKSLEDVAKALYEYKINDSVATTIAELRDDHDRIINEIRETFELKGLIK